MADARTMQKEATARLEAGDWRDAAEKAWCAVRNASQALVLEIYGVDNPRSANIDSGIRALAKERGGEWINLRRTFSDVVYHLHIEGFYGGVFHEDIPDLIHSVAEYIQNAEELAVSGQ